MNAPMTKIMVYILYISIFCLENVHFWMNYPFMVHDTSFMAVFKYIHIDFFPAQAKHSEENEAEIPF